MNVATTKICPRCKTSFECKAASTERCQCTKIDLSKIQKDFLATNYVDCLGFNCLKQIKNYTP